MDRELSELRDRANKSEKELSNAKMELGFVQKEAEETDALKDEIKKLVYLSRCALVCWWSWVGD